MGTLIRESVKIHQVYHVYYTVRFHFPKVFETNTEELAMTVRMLDEIDGWNINDADKVECLTTKVVMKVLNDGYM